MEKKISSFRGEYSFLRNMYDSPVKYGGLEYKNSEAAYQAQKCANAAEREKFVGLDGADAKKLGLKVALRADWEDVKVRAMSAVVRAKFSQSPGLTEKLAATGDAVLEEGNDWGDEFWGTVDGKGENQLGKILMDVRADLCSDVAEGTSGKKDLVKMLDELDGLIMQRVKCAGLSQADLAEGGRYHKAYVRLIDGIKGKAGEIMKLYLHSCEPRKGSAAWPLWRQAAEDNVRETRERAHWALFERIPAKEETGGEFFSPSGEFLCEVAVTEFGVREDVKAAIAAKKREEARKDA